MKQQEDRDAKTVNGCIARIENAISQYNFQEAEKWAKKILNLRKDLGYYHLGAAKEFQGDYSQAKNYYELGIKSGSKECEMELDQIRKNGYATKRQIENVVDYYKQRNQNYEIIAYNMALQISNLEGDQSSPGNKADTNKSSKICFKCNGTGWEPQRYRYATGTYYFNGHGVKCVICGYSD